MRIIVFGPTGGTGQQLVSQALTAGHEATAFARNPDAIKARPRLTIAVGNIQDLGAARGAIAEHDAVLCALGGRPWRRREHVCSRAIRVIAPTMTKLGVRRLVAISTFGAGETRPHVGWLARKLLFGLVLRSEVADKEAMERELSSTDLDWIVVRVGLLTDGPACGVWRAADDGSIRRMGKIARADVAAFMLAQLEHDTWLRRKPVVMYQDLTRRILGIIPGARCYHCKRMHFSLEYHSSVEFKCLTNAQLCIHQIVSQSHARKRRAKHRSVRVRQGRERLASDDYITCRVAR